MRGWWMAMVFALAAAGCGAQEQPSTPPANEREAAAVSAGTALRERVRRDTVRQRRRQAGQSAENDAPPATRAEATPTPRAKQVQDATSPADADAPAEAAQAASTGDKAPGDGRIYLFNGKDLTGWHASGPYNDWVVEDGVLKTGGSIMYDKVFDDAGRQFYARATSDLISQRKFWNFQLHLEFQCPVLTILPDTPVAYAQYHQFTGPQLEALYGTWKGDPPGAPPSDWRMLATPGGVFLRGRYRVHLVTKQWESYQPLGSLVLRDHPYGRCGAIYGKVPVQESAAGKPGQWQSLDVTLVDRKVTVVLNGKTVIDDKEIPGPTGGALDIRENEAGPIVIQGLMAGVTWYRNVWLRKLPGEPHRLNSPFADSLPQIELPKTHNHWVPHGGKPSPYLPVAAGNRWVYRISKRPFANAAQRKHLDWSTYHQPRFKGDDSYRSIPGYAPEHFHSHFFFGLAGSFGLEHPGPSSFGGGGLRAKSINHWHNVERLRFTCLREARDQPGWWIMRTENQDGVVPEDYRWQRHGIEHVRWGPAVKMYDFSNLRRARAYKPLPAICERLVGTGGYFLIGFAPTKEFRWVPPLSKSHVIAGKWAETSIDVPASRFNRCWESLVQHTIEGRTLLDKTYLVRNVGLVKRVQIVRDGKEEIESTLWELESYEVHHNR